LISGILVLLAGKKGFVRIGENIGGDKTCQVEGIISCNRRLDH